MAGPAGSLRAGRHGATPGFVPPRLVPLRFTRARAWHAKAYPPPRQLPRVAAGAVIASLVASASSATAGGCGDPIACLLVLLGKTLYCLLHPGC